MKTKYSLFSIIFSFLDSPTLKEGITDSVYNVDCKIATPVIMEKALSIFIKKNE